MGSDHSHPVDIDPQALQEARHFWTNYTKAATMSIVSIAVLLLLGAIFLA